MAEAAALAYSPEYLLYPSTGTPQEAKTRRAATPFSSGKKGADKYGINRPLAGFPKPPKETDNLNGGVKRGGLKSANNAVI